MIPFRDIKECRCLLQGGTLPLRPWNPFGDGESRFRYHGIDIYHTQHFF